MDELAFLNKILHTPNDDAPLLVYADWLEEQGEPVASDKAEFIRLTVAETAETGSERVRPERKSRLGELAASLEPAWLAIVSRLPVENCSWPPDTAKTRLSLPLQFDFVCGRRWEELSTTEDVTVRFCDQCQKDVQYCNTISEARHHARQGHCIAVHLGVPRSKDDLRMPPVQLMGVALPDDFDDFPDDWGD